MVTRRAVLRGDFALGLAGVAGIPLSACGDESTNAGGAAPAADLGGPTPAPGKTVRPGARSGAQPTSKTDVYQRGPEQRRALTTDPAPAPAPEPTPEAVTGGKPTGEPTVATRSGDNLATARQGKDSKGAKGNGRPTATPAPLPPGAFARTSEIPVGGGKAFPDQKIVVTQPAEAPTRASAPPVLTAGAWWTRSRPARSSARATAAGSPIADGTVEKGPATVPLPAQAIAVGAGRFDQQGLTLLPRALRPRTDLRTQLPPRENPRIAG